MGTIRRQSIQATMVMAVGVLLGFVLKLFVFTAYLSTEQIGLLTTLLDAANFFAAFIPLGSQAIFVKYLPFFRTKKNGDPKGLLSIGFILSTVGFSIFLLLFLFFKESIIAFYQNQAPLFSKYIYLLIPLVAFRVLFTVGQAYGWALKKNIFPLIVKDILVRVLTGIIVITFAAHWFSLDGLVIWFVMVYFISGAVMTYYLFRGGFLDLSKPGKKLRQGKGKEILYFGFFAIMTSAGDIIIRNVDSLMITSMVSLEATGIYTIAFFIGQIIELPRRAVGQITAPFVAEASAKNDKTQIATLFHKTAINQFLIGSILLICVWTNIDSLFELIPNGNEYRSGKFVVLIIGLGKLFDMSMGINSNIIQHSEYYRFNFYTMSLMGIIGIATNIILIPVLGITGAAIASLITIALANIIKGIFLSYRFHLQPFNLNFMKAIIISLLSSGLAYALPTLPFPLLDIVYRSIIVIVAFGTVVFLTNVSKDSSQLIQLMLKKLKIYRK